MIRQFIHNLLKELRQITMIRRLFLRLFAWLHNTSYHMISFFGSPTGTHPKHDIMKYYQFFINHLTPSNTVLDVGSGKGEVAYKVAQHVKKIDGIDFTPTHIAHAKKHYQHPNLTFIQGDALTHNFDHTYDTIILSNVLEHIDKRIDFLKQLTIIAPKILIRVPLLTRDWVTVFKKQQGLEYRLDDTHYIEYDLDTFKKEVYAAGLKIKELHINFGEIYAVCIKP